MERITIRLSIILATVAIYPASAQIILTIPKPDGTTYINLPAVEECAKEPFHPIEAPDSKDSFSQISFCRALLTGFVAGWRAAAPGKQPPIVEVPSINDGDFGEKHDGR